ncbi:hypothetical protein F4680DRAFT_109541 [Xylaria scruposa]|nr:hypothetical protein F4680DRAFT_109541 [Xylaria scruposa]
MRTFLRRLVHCYATITICSFAPHLMWSLELQRRHGIGCNKGLKYQVPLIPRPRDTTSLIYSGEYIAGNVQCCLQSIIRPRRSSKKDIVRRGDVVE